MNLTGKFITFNFALMTIVVTLGGTSVWNAYALVRASQSTTAEYEAVDLAQTASTQVFWFRSNLRGAGGNVYRDVKYFDPIRKDINDLTLQIGIAGRSNEGPDPIQTQLVQ